MTPSKQAVPRNLPELIKWLEPLTKSNNIEEHHNPQSVLVCYDLYFCQLSDTDGRLPRYCTKIRVDYKTEHLVFFNNFGTPVRKMAFDQTQLMLDELRRSKDTV